MLTKFAHSELPYPRMRDKDGLTKELREYLRRVYGRYACPAFYSGIEKKDGRVETCKCPDCRFDEVWLARWWPQHRILYYRG